MRNVDFSRNALTSCVAAAMLAGCGGSQPPIGAPGAMPQPSALATHADRGKSWMKGASSSQDLLYVSSTNGNVYVYTYPQGKLTGTLTGLLGPIGECVDSAGDVFIVAAANASYETSTIYEYAHGGTTPIATLSDQGAGFGCAVDAGTGNLAVANISDQENPNNPGYGDVAVYAGAQGSATMYYSSAYSSFGDFPGYDNKSNFYVVAESPQNHDQELVRLSNGSGSFEAIRLKEKVSSGYRFWPTVQWDGKHTTVSSDSAQGRQRSDVSVYRLSISRRHATAIGTTKLDSPRNLHGSQSWIQSNTIVGTYYYKGYANVASWQYPNGGEPRSTIKKITTASLLGLAISSAAK